MATLQKKILTGLLGNSAGTKLYNWLNPCCTEFCNDVNKCVTSGTVVRTEAVNYNLKTSPGKTSLVYTTPLTGDIDLSVDVSNNSLGDTLLIYATADGSSRRINLLGNFFYTQCGGQNNYIELDERVVAIFTFDGSYFVSTYDNC